MTPKQSNISVLFASPHALTRELVVKALSRHKHFRVIATTTNEEDAIEAVRSTACVWNVALIRVTLADGPMSGFGLLRKICEIAPKAKSVILFETSEHHLVVDAFRAGAKGVFCLSQGDFKSLRPVRGAGPRGTDLGQLRLASGGRSSRCYRPTRSIPTAGECGKAAG